VRKRRGCCQKYAPIRDIRRSRSRQLPILNRSRVFCSKLVMPQEIANNESDPRNSAEYARASAERFLKYDFAEAKDLCKQFLTLIAGILVFSVTFGDKIVDVAHASLPSKFLLLASWGLFLIAIVLTGAGLWLIFYAGLIATHTPENRSKRLSLKHASFYMLTAAGVSFVLGLLSLIASALRAG
jgi:hypothetical protein